MAHEVLRERCAWYTALYTFVRECMLRGIASLENQSDKLRGTGPRANISMKHGLVLCQALNLAPYPKCFYLSNLGSFLLQLLYSARCNVGMILIFGLSVMSSHMEVTFASTSAADTVNEKLLSEMRVSEAEIVS